MEPDEFGRIIELQDAIEESDIFTRYSEYIDRVIEFTERNVIPLSKQPEVLREYVGAHPGRTVAGALMPLNWSGAG